MTINRKSFVRQNFTCRIKPETRDMIDMLAAKFSDEADSHIALGTVVDRAIAREAQAQQLSETDLRKAAKRRADAAEKTGSGLGS